MGKPDDLVDVVQRGGADAVAMADVLHYKRCSLKDIRSRAREAGIAVRA
jgi:cyclase